MEDNNQTVAVLPKTWQTYPEPTEHEIDEDYYQGHQWLDKGLVAAAKASTVSDKYYPTPSVTPAEDGAWRRMELVQMLIPVAAQAGATSVENIINTVAKLERYIITGINPLEQPVIDHGPFDGPIESDVFEADIGEGITVDASGTLQYAT